jgi:hypothetical protein
MKQHLLLLALAFLPVSFITAQEDKQPVFDAEAPTEVLQSEQFSITFTLTGTQGDGFDFDQSKITNAEVLYGPSVSTFSSTNYSGGTRRTEIKQIYKFVLRPVKKKGKIEIPEATITANGEKLVTKALKLKIVEKKNDNSTQKQSAKADKEQSSNTPQSSLTISDEDVFLKAVIARRTLELKEEITLTYRLYVKPQLEPYFSGNIQNPNFNGLNVTQIQLPRQNEFIEETLNGVDYKAMDIAKFKISAQRAGNYTISPYKVELMFDTISDKEQLQQMDQYRRMRTMLRKQIESAAVNIAAGVLL